MRFILGFLAGLLGMIVGWAALAFLVISVQGLGQDGGIGMAAFFLVGPIGGLVGFVIGVLLFIMVVRVRERPR